MRTTPLLLSALFGLVSLGCGGDKDGEAADSGPPPGFDSLDGADGGDGTGDGSDGGSTVTCPDEVPEAYRNIWDCSTERCGAPVLYRYATGASTASALDINESWFIFFDEATWCVDTFNITGTYSPIDPTTYNCAGCEEIWESTWQMSTGNTCNISWGQLFERDSDEAEGPFYGFTMFDTHGSLSGRNDDNAMLVFTATSDSAGGPYSFNINWAEGTANPTTEADSYPHDYEYVSDALCTARSTQGGPTGQPGAAPTLPTTIERLSPQP